MKQGKKAVSYVEKPASPSALSGAHLCTEANTLLDQYVGRPTPHYFWEEYNSYYGTSVTTHFLRLVSQQWRTPDEVDRPVWEHELKVTVPNTLFRRPSGHDLATAILVVKGGDYGTDPSAESGAAIERLAISLCSVVVELGQVPNQPLCFADEPGRLRREDEILAYSMNKFLLTGDPEWPVHLAMANAVVKAMDAVQDLMNGKGRAINDFIIAGSSKRGWTTWLTAAVDPRAKAIMAISIDMLNLGKQFIHHCETYGYYAPALGDYLEYDLGYRMLTPEGEALLDIIDPYAYRTRYTMPKLIVNSAGDQFFVSDSSRLYYHDLPGPKCLRYTINTDHSQGDASHITDLILATRSWLDDIRNDRKPPDFTWTFEPDGSIRVQTFTRPRTVRLWQAHNPQARDFRLEVIGNSWTDTGLEDMGGGFYVGNVPQPTEGFTAFVVELKFEQSNRYGVPQIYTTDVCITPATLPFHGITHR